MREQGTEAYEDVASWGQVVKGDEAFADRVLQLVGDRPVIRQGLLVEQVAREVARRQDLALMALRSASRGRQVSQARLLTVWLGREVGAISVARTAKYFGRDASAMVRGVARVEHALRTDKSFQLLAEKLRRAVRSINATKHD